LSVFITRLKVYRPLLPLAAKRLLSAFFAAMNDDFGTPEACAVLFEMVREINRLRDTDLNAAAALAARLKELASVLGVLQLEADDFLRAGAEGRVDAAEVEALIQARLTARADKDWAASDRIRDQLTAMGVVLEDGKGGTTWRLAD
jgi:cysteinyl-tRNA synthetase